MTLIRYIGGNDGKEVWRGPVTAQRYEFGGKKVVGYVDNRDYAEMLKLRDGDRRAFAKYKAPKEVATPPPPAEIVPEEEAPKDANGRLDLNESESPTLDVLGLSDRYIRILEAEGLTVPELANIDIENLVAIKGIGYVGAKQIISLARDRLGLEVA